MLLEKVQVQMVWVIKNGIFVLLRVLGSLITLSHLKNAKPELKCMKRVFSLNIPVDKYLAAISHYRIESS